MYKARLCLGAVGGFSLSLGEQVKMFKNAGFEGFFTSCYADTNFAVIRKCADDNGMYLQSLHAPFVGMADIWEDEYKGREVLDELIACVRGCAQISVPILVVHAIIGFDKHTPTELGIKFFSELAEEAEKLGVKLAFENTEGREYLDAVLTALKDKSCVGFCWDSGHEKCYSHTSDLLEKYGSKLFCTHLNDNLGIRDYNGKITYFDDLHLLPFDGIINWEKNTKRLAGCSFDNWLTFELSVGSKHGRYDNHIYSMLPPEVFVAEAYKRACRVAALYTDAKES